MTPKPKGPHGGGGDDGGHPHGGDGGDGSGSHGRPSQQHGNIDASKGITSAQEATQSAAQQGRAKGAGKNKQQPAPPPEPTTPPAKPDFDNPEFDDRKLTEYALNPEHPVGKNKARVIKSRTGLGPEDAASVKQQILDQVGDGEPIAGKMDQHGSRWNKDVTLTGPDGTITVRTAWIVDATTGKTRLVTLSFP
ncbi:MAG TPA: hypothetical protein VGP26_26690 [Actinophytocola sp.]|jgi:hypothetical protein|nr:hypothetical protein [Actinophytocola sp.]